MVMDACSPQDPCEQIVFCSSSQSGKTEFINNFVGYIVDQDPGPTLVIQPNTKPMAETWSKDRLTPMIRDTEVLHNKISPAKGRDSGNTITHKKFEGGHLTIGGANSPAGLASRPIRYLIMDEIDRYETTKEGNAISLATARTKRFWNRKIIKTSSPTYQESGVLAELEDCDTLYHLLLPCLACNEYQFPRLKCFEWDGDDLSTTEYVCGHCGHRHPLTDEYRIKLMAEWVEQKQGPGRKKGFHMNQLASSLGSWIESLSEFQTAKKDPEKLKVFVNTTLAEGWEERGESMESRDLLLRCEEYKTDVPQGGLLLTAGIDIQTESANPRIEMSVYAWGVGEECWLIDHLVLYGNPHQSEVWQDLDDALLTEYRHESGAQLTVQAAFIDSGDGNVTSTVYGFTRQRRVRHIYAVKGRGGDGIALLSEPKPQQPSNTLLFSLGVDEAKATIMARILAVTEFGPGYWHFPVRQYIGESFFKQLTGEQRVREKTKTGEKFIWKKRQRRQEAFDCAVYAYAAMRMRIRQLGSFETLSRRMRGEGSDYQTRPQNRKPVRRGVRGRL